MKKILVALVLAAPPTAWSQLITVTNLNNIQYWTGSGTNGAGLVLEFGTNSTPTSIAWGYRWNGLTNTAATMLLSLAGTITGSSAPSPLPGADARLSVDLSYFAGYGGFFVNTINYDQRGLPSPWSPTTRIIQDDYFDDGTYPTFYTLNSTGLWSSSFALAQVGMSDTILSNGMWIGFVQSDGLADLYTFTQPKAAVPEPRSLTFLVLAFGLLVATRRWKLSRS